MMPLNRVTIALVCVGTAIYLTANNITIDSAIDLRRILHEHIKHKDLFPLNQSDWVGTILVGLGTMIAASGGIGGGGILVPLLILVYGFHPKYAIPLSNFTILGSSITNMVLNLNKRHPFTDRPLVDWDLILVMEPLTMGGAVVGAFFSKILPDWVLVLSLVVLLAYTTKTTVEKGISQWNEESAGFENEKKSALAKAMKSLEDANDEQMSSSLLRDDSDDEDNDDPEAFTSFKEVEDPQLKAILDAEKVTQYDKVGIIIVLVIVVLFLNMIKGGGSFPSPFGIQCGSSGYWLLTSLVFIWIIAVFFYTRSMLIEGWKQKKRLNYKFAQGDIEWNEHNTVVYPLLCFFAGFFAGLFGVGGGIVKGPLMLHMGIHPFVASGTVAVMIMFTSVAATTMFIAFGTMTWDYAIFLFIVGLATTVIGQFGVGYLVKKYRRVSLVSLSIGLVVAISTVLLAIQSVFSLVEAQKGGGDSNSLCKN